MEKSDQFKRLSFTHNRSIILTHLHTSVKFSHNKLFIMCYIWDIWNRSSNR